MELKTLGIKGKLALTKDKVLKLVRMIGSFRDENSDVSPPNHVFTKTPFKQVNERANYALEAELKRAEGLEHWRRWLDRPK